MSHSNASFNYCTMLMFHVVNHEEKNKSCLLLRNAAFLERKHLSENFCLVCLLTWGMCNDGSLKRMPFYCNCSRLSLKANRTRRTNEGGDKGYYLYVVSHRHDTCNCLKLRACVFVNLSITYVPLNISLRTCTKTRKHADIQRLVHTTDKLRLNLILLQVLI